MNEKPIDTTKFQTVEAWEKHNPGYLFEHFYFYKNTNLVRKVCGRVTVQKKTLDMGTVQNHAATKKVRWNGQGHCYSGNFNRRNRDYDIHF